jgi:hypothetical protein
LELIHFRCSSCKEGLTAATDMAGRTVKCACGAELTVPAPVATALDNHAEKRQGLADLQPLAGNQEESGLVTLGATPSDAESGEAAQSYAVRPDEEGANQLVARKHAGRRPREAGEKERGHGWSSRSVTGWRMVRIGLLLMIVAKGVAVAVSLLMIPLIFLLPLMFSTLFFQLGLIISVSVFLCDVFLRIAGRSFCLFVPPKNHCRGLAIAALALEVGILVVMVPLWLSLLLFPISAQDLLEQVRAGDTTAFMTRIRHQMIWLTVWGMVMQLLGYAGMFVFPLFLRAVALSLKEDRVAENCIGLLKLSAAAVLIGLVSRLVSPLLGTTWISRLVWPVVAIGSMLGLAQTVWSLIMTVQLRGAITQELQRRRAFR